MNRELADKLEPKASPPSARAQVLEEFASRGVETWLFLGPIIPEISDSEENIKEVVETAKQASAKIIYDQLNLRRWVLDRLAPVLERERPGLAKMLPSLTGKKSEWWRRVRSTVESICKELEVRCEPSF
jgi:DNA repair photolyase